MNFPNEPGGFNPMMIPGMGIMQGNAMMNPGMGMMWGNPMMNPFLLQQQQAMMNKLLMQKQFGQVNQPNMFNQSNALQQFNQNMVQKQQLINNNNIIKPNPQNSNYVNIFFKLQKLNGPDVKPFSVQCSLNDKVSTVIQKFRTKAQDYDVQHEKFIFNGKRLNETLTVAESGLEDNMIVFVINDRDLEGAF